MSRQCAATSCVKYALEGHCLHRLISVLPVQVRRIAIFPDSENELDRRLPTINSFTECTPNSSRLLGERGSNNQGFLILACQLLHFPFTLARCGAIFLLVLIDKFDRAAAASIVSAARRMVVFLDTSLRIGSDSCVQCAVVTPYYVDKPRFLIR